METKSLLIFESYFATVGGNQRYIRMLGVLVDPGDRKGLAKATIELSGDPDRRPELGSLDREEAYGGYSFNSHLGHLREIPDAVAAPKQQTEPLAARRPAA